MNKPFIITIDTEGDNLWASYGINNKITTINARYLFRFQELCEKYGFITTYLTNYEMACDDAMIELGREGLKKKALEIGAHEHAWNQPPYCPLIKQSGTRGLPFLGEYPKLVIRKKLYYLTCLLQDTFQCDIQSHRGGRWYLDQCIVDELVKLGYKVDCTCTPGVNWSTTKGWSFFSKGIDWSAFPCAPFYLKTNFFKEKKEPGLLEIPVTIMDLRNNGYYSWLRPSQNNRREMFKVIDNVVECKGYAEFMLHSSELMPGGSPTFTNKSKIEKLYRDMDELFSYAVQKGFVGMGLVEFAEKYAKEKHEYIREVGL